MNNERVTTFPFDSTEFPFNIEMSGITNCDDRYEVYREKSYCYILEYIYGGSGTLFCNGREYRLEKGDAYILPKGSCHRYYATDTWDKIWFNIDGTLVSNLLYSYNLQNTVVFKRFNNKAVFDNLYELTNSSLPVKDIMTIGAIRFHSIIQKLYDFRQKDSVNIKVNTIKEILDNHLYEKDISLKNIANELCMSQAQVISIFKKTFDMTPYQYFAKKRIEIASDLLLNSNMQVKEIADMLNYADQPYFSNAFKKIMGVSPEKYRKMNVNIIQRQANIHNKFTVEATENLPFDLTVERR